MGTYLSILNIFEKYGFVFIDVFEKKVFYHASVTLCHLGVQCYILPPFRVQFWHAVMSIGTTLDYE